tara:strand:+ start:3391 stop:3540 length:150 start_codon:yes stop_codon:yes gene_type:complete
MEGLNRITKRDDNAGKIALDAITILSSLGYTQYSIPLHNRLEAVLNERN